MFFSLLLYVRKGKMRDIPTCSFMKDTVVVKLSIYCKHCVTSENNGWAQWKPTNLFKDVWKVCRPYLVKVCCTLWQLVSCTVPCCFQCLEKIVTFNCSIQFTWSIYLSINRYFKRPITELKRSISLSSYKSSTLFHSPYRCSVDVISDIGTLDSGP